MINFMKNPVGFVATLIITLVVISSYMDVIITATIVVVIAGLALTIAKKALLGKGKPQISGSFCSTCGHFAHGRQNCNQCGCAMSP